METFIHGWVELIILCWCAAMAMAIALLGFVVLNYLWETHVVKWLSSVEDTFKRG
jgi:hypothetical protein